MELYFVEKAATLNLVLVVLSKSSHKSEIFTNEVIYANDAKKMIFRIKSNGWKVPYNVTTAEYVP